MKFIFKVWVLTFTIDLLDISDGNIKVAVTLSWK